MTSKIHSVDKAVYDPAHRKDGSYWQWSSMSLDPTWDRIAEVIHRGWPGRQGSFEDQSAVCFGVVDESAASRWFYRVYAGGRDSFGRPGRYFFVLFRFHSQEDVLFTEVSGFLNYFEGERRLPLNTTPLDGDVPGSEPNDLLLTLHRQWVQGGNGMHWGMDAKGSVVRFAAPLDKAPMPPAMPSPPVPRPAPQPTPRKSVIGLPVGLALGFLFGLLLGAWLGYRWGLSRGHRDGTNAVLPQSVRMLPTGPNTAAIKPKEANERPNSEGRVDERPAEKKSSDCPAADHDQGKATNPR